MSKKWVRSLEDLRKMNNENEDSWQQRKIVATSILEHIEKFPLCKIRLYQQKGISEIRRIPDFLVRCKSEYLWAIEIGITGKERKEELESIVDEVVHIKRKTNFDWGLKRICQNCPYEI
jgi:hypothetical protein